MSEEPKLQDGRLERGDRRARAWLCGVRERVPRLFAHWELRYTTW